ncbi:hypothetical protein [Fredinandcohnia onubensis]|nr:hypothetical protein [Fredinandcohnia onubensis]
MSSWVTPEEMERKRKRNKTLLYILLPIAAIIVSAATTIFANSL